MTSQTPRGPKTDRRSSGSSRSRADSSSPTNPEGNPSDPSADRSASRATPGNKLLVVESPAKARTIGKLLSRDWSVVASYGHMRDLAVPQGVTRTDQGFHMDWQLAERAQQHLPGIVGQVRSASLLCLATDPDREGEAIAWHLLQLLTEQIPLPPVQRIVFHELTPGALGEALKHPRDINQDLVDAYFTRRALDYLVGFNLSPVLWRKLPNVRSAGRVQSVALRLICERDVAIRRFRPTESWTIEVIFLTAQEEPLRAQLYQVGKRKLEASDLPNRAAAEALAERLKPLSFVVAKRKRTKVKRRPSPPFITSTLQQEALHKLRLSPSNTMQLAQKLYEGVSIDGTSVGLITYMRTDSTRLSPEACQSARKVIVEQFGDAYVPKQPRQYKSKVKNAQEAHEAIRPTSFARLPASLASQLEPRLLDLYTLIWRRSIACQMTDAEFEQVTVEITDRGNEMMLRSTGSRPLFDGFQKVYVPTSNDSQTENPLPSVYEGEELKQQDVIPAQHFTRPPARFNEASLIKQLEDLGIGRPSTYATILQVLQERGYVRLDKGRFMPEEAGLLCNAFLVSFFERYVEYGFTASMEDQLDAISAGKEKWQAALEQFWQPFSTSVEQGKHLDNEKVRLQVETALRDYLWVNHKTANADPNATTDANPQDDQPPKEPKEPTRPRCPVCQDGQLYFKIVHQGTFFGCSNYPACAYTRSVSWDGSEDPEAVMSFPKQLGVDPKTHMLVSLRRGPFGMYVQLGDARDKTQKGNIKRISVPKFLHIQTLDIATALRLLELPRKLGNNPASQEVIQVGINRMGSYVRCGSRYQLLSPDEDILAVDLARALKLLESPAAKDGASESSKSSDGSPAKRSHRSPRRSLGAHPDDQQPVEVGQSQYGVYVCHGRVYASVPKGQDVERITLADALRWLAEKESQPGARIKTSSRSANKSSTSKTSTRAAKSTTNKQPSANKKPTARKDPRKS